MTLAIPADRRGAEPARRRHPVPLTERRRALLVLVALGGAFLAEGAQLSRLALEARGAPKSSQVEPLARSAARPDIVDRRGRLLATDIAVPSLFADPARVVDADDASEQLAAILPSLDAGQLRRELAEKSRRFLWIKRGISPGEAQRIHELGLPGIGFRTELRRVYPVGQSAAHILGFVDVENRGTTGIEAYIDKSGGLEIVDGPVRSTRLPIALSIDLSVQHALRAELVAAMARYATTAAAGLVLDVRTGEVLAASSLPDYEAGNARASLEPENIDRLVKGTYELGSVFKTVTLALASEAGQIAPGKLYDARTPLPAGSVMIDDFHPTRRMLTAEGVFLHSSNIGAAQMALEAGAERQRELLARIGLTGTLHTEIGDTGRPRLPDPWQKVSTMTVAYGHGIAVAPLQFAAGTAVLFNGGRPLQPTFLRVPADPAVVPAKSVLKSETVDLMRQLMQRNVQSKEGTGGRAAVAGYDVGGKTGTADIPGKAGYGANGVLASFLAILPSRSPRYLIYVLLWEPKATAASDSSTAAGLNAAPTAGRIIERVAPLLELPPEASAG